jgi:hypothetical protein
MKIFDFQIFASEDKASYMGLIDNKRGLQLVVSTAIVMIISVVVLTGLFILFKDNFGAFQEGTEGILESTGGVAAKQACELACEAGSRFIYCCKKYEVLNEKVMCGDERLEISCALDCSDFNCDGN